MIIMAKAKKLPSGSWRCQVYSHSIPVTDKSGNPILDSKGKRREKRIYESFTSDDPSPAGKREAELAAAQFAAEKERRKHTFNYTVKEAIDKYVESSDAVLSPTTIQGYRSIRRNSFQDIMNMPLKKLSTDILQESVNKEARRPSNKRKKNSKPISPKTVSNSYGLLTAVINRYYPSLNCSVRLPAKESTVKELIPPEIIMDVVKGTPVELPALLAMWLSFSMSEVRGLTKSKSIHDGYITIEEVVVDIDGKPIRKKQAKTCTRIRKHRIPPYILDLINQLPSDTDEFVTLSSQAIYSRFRRLLKKNDLPHMTFHDLRHVNASVMALLRIPDKYAMERGGWKTDNVMKKVYTHTFSAEREEVDNMIDAYFEKKMQHEMQHEKKKA